MKIVKLQAENVKRIKAIEIIPEDNLVVISGKNEQGKTSVLDAIWLALQGAQAAKKNTRVIRDGADTASVTVDLGDLIVTRSWKDDKTTLKVTSKEGATYPSPQGMLDSLIGRMSFDLFAFANMDDKTQLKTLLDLVDLPFVPADIEASKALLYSARTDVNRQLKAAQAALGTKPENAPTEEISVQSLLNELRDAQSRVAEYDGVLKRHQSLANQIRELTETLARLSDQHEELTQTLNNFGDLPNVGEIETKLASVDEKNAAFRAAQEYDKKQQLIKELTASANDLTEKMQNLEDNKAQALANAKMPIEGLAFDDDGVTYKGIPFRQCSAAERLRVSLAIAMALNPTIKVIRIEDGSLLDSDNLALIGAMAAEQDYQIWIEKVDGNVGIVIEDGQVA